MKKLTFLLITILISCNKVKNTKKEESSGGESMIENTQIDSIIKPEIKTAIITYKSTIRPKEKLILESVYTDTVQFKNFNNEGDYFLFNAQKNKTDISLIYDLISDNKFDFIRGDDIEIKWRIDSLWISGDGETLDFSEWLIAAKKIKEDKVSQFRKNYGRPIKYINHHESYSDSYLDDLYKLVEYYLANFKQELVKTYVNNPNKAGFIYSIEEKEENGRTYTVIGISTNFESHTSIIQWLYYDLDKDILYEYDLANVRLVEVK